MPTLDDINRLALSRMAQDPNVYQGITPDTRALQGIAGGGLMQQLVNNLALAGKGGGPLGVLEGMPPFGGTPQKIDYDELMRRVNARNLLYHATPLENVEGILKSGNIKPSAYNPTVQLENVPGVSTSRVPKVSTTAYGSPVTFALDPTKMPATRPFAEEGYQKTSPWGRSVNQPNKPNTRFEFENRTYNQPIPTSAIREVIVDKSGLPVAQPETSTKADMISNLTDLVKRYLNVPVRTVESGIEQHRYRAGIGKE